MASASDNLYVTYVDFDRDLLKVWGQRNRIGGTYIERLLMQLLPEFNKTPSPNPNRIHKGMFCFAKYTDDNYYRARVISRVEGDSVGVLFVDYGNRDTIKVSDIRVQDGRENDVLVKMSEQAEEYYLARVAAPPLGWTRDILSEIRRDICYDEFHHQIVDQIGDQKILNVQFRNEDFSNYLVKKQLARPLPLPVQREMILSYCSLVSNGAKHDDAFRESPSRLPFSSSLPPSNMRVPPKPANIHNGINMQLNYPKPNAPVNFSCPPPPIHFPPSRHLRGPFHQVESNVPKNSFYHPVGQMNNQIPIDPVSVRPMNPGLNPVLSHQIPQYYQIPENMDPCVNANNHNNSNLIELIAQQVKQYIAKDSAKTENEMEKAPHHYVNSVLEVGNTYNVIISYIDDGPWSFSIQLLSSEMELQKLMDELSSVELVPIKPPVILGYPCIGSSVLYGNLCRGVVVSISRSAVKVYFVDFGNTEDLPVSSIYELPPKFFKTRVLSQKFSLNGLQKVAYSDDIKKFFREVVQDGLLVLRVISLEDDNLPTCELYLKERNIKRILNEKMRELRNSVLEDFPKVGDTENVLVTWVVSPQKFFVQLSKRDPDLSALKKELEEVGTKGQQLTYQQLSVGFKCVCQYAADGHWYRAVITSVDSENEISVFYIDYGNTETVGISSLRKVDGSGLINQMNNQALQCSLKGFENQPFDEELSKLLESLIMEKELQMVVASSEKQLLCVQLLDNGNDISSSLMLLKSESKKQVKEKEFDTSSCSPLSPWSSSESGKPPAPNRLEKEIKPLMGISFEQNFRGDQNRKEYQKARPFKNLQSVQPPPGASHSLLKNRFEDRSYNNKSTFQDPQPKGWRSQSPREFGEWDAGNTAGSRGPARGRDESQTRLRSTGGGGRGFGQPRNRAGREDKSRDDRGREDRNREDKSRDDRGREDRSRDGRGREDKSRDDRGREDKSRDDRGREDRSREDRGRDDRSREDRSRDGRGRDGRSKDDRRMNGCGDKKFGESRGGGGGGTCDDREGKRFEVNRGWGDSIRGGEDSKRKSNDRTDKPEERTSTRGPIRKDEIAPPGSKFEERILEIGKSEKGIVTYYFSPDEFFIQLLDHEEEFKKMMKEIQEYYSDKYSIRDPVNPGDIVIAQFSHDKILYRAEVVKSAPVTVRYIDYGNQEPVQSKGTWFVAKQFLKLPQQVIKCRLSGVRPLDSDWPPPGSGVDKFFEFPEYKCTFLQKEGDIHEISMEVLENGRDVAGEIIAAGLGRPLDPGLDIPETDYSLLGNQILRLFVSHVDSTSQFYIVVNPKASELLVEAITTLTDGNRGLPSLDWSKLEPDMPCLATTDDASWHRGKILKAGGESALVWLCDRGDRVELAKDKVVQIPDYLKSFQPQAVQCSLHGVSFVKSEGDFKKAVECRSHLVHVLSVEDKRLSVALYDDEGRIHQSENVTYNDDIPKTVEPVGQLPILSQRLPIVVSHLESVREVYIQRIADEVDLLNFLEQIHAFYQEEGENWPENEEIPAGALVAAKSVLYDAWYRGRVTSSVEDKLEVLYIDYGNREILPRESLKVLDSSFLGMNAFCRAVALDGCFDEDGVREKFWGVCDGKDLVGHFRNCGGLLIDLRTGEESLNDLLKVSPPESNGFEEESTRDVVQESTPDALEDIKVFISHIDSPGHFWVHKEKFIPELELLQDNLQKHCEFCPDKTDPKEGDLVAAAFSDRWYRAKVIAANDEQLEVQFIDYGNTSVVDLKTEVVKELAPEMVTAPVFATLFALKGNWSENSTGKFTDIILRNMDPLTMTVLEEGDPLVVDLLQNGRSVTEMLEKEVATQIEYDSDLPTVYITHAISPLDFYVQRESSTAALKELIERLSDAQNFDNPTSIETGQLYAARYPEDEAWYRARVIDDSGDDVTVRFVDYGNVSIVNEVKCLPEDLVDIPNLSENCSLVYGRSCDSWSSAAADLFAEYADGRPLQMKVVLKRSDRAIVRLFHENKSVSEELEALCQKDGRKEMYVTHAVSPTDFYIQHVDDEECKLIAEALQNGGECEILEEREVGAICQGQLPEDGCWYRGRILRDLGDSCEMFFIDFGFTGLAKDVRKLPEEIRDIPPRAIKCSLDLPAVTKNAQEEFVTLTAAGAAVFRGRILSPGETNIISLKLDGRIIEDTLEVIPETGVTNGHQKSPEEIHDDRQVEEEPEEGEESAAVVEAEEAQQQQQEEKDSRLDAAVEQKNPPKNKVHKIVPGSISRGESISAAREKPRVLFKKFKFSERLVPGSISRGVSMEAMAEEPEEMMVPEEKHLSKSAPNTPHPLRKGEYVKVDVNDRLVPGCISTGIPLCCSPNAEKTPRNEKIVPGAVNGNH